MSENQLFEPSKIEPLYRWLLSELEGVDDRRYTLGISDKNEKLYSIEWRQSCIPKMNKFDVDWLSFVVWHKGGVAFYVKHTDSNFHTFKYDILIVDDDTIDKTIMSGGFHCVKACAGWYDSFLCEEAVDETHSD